MERLLAIIASNLEPFRHFTPESWFSFAGALTPPLGIGLAVAGVLAALWGGRLPAFRVIAGVLGVVFGVLFTPEALRLSSGIHALSPRVVGLVLPALLAVLGAAIPLALVALATGTVGCLIGGALVADSDLLVGAVPGFILGGVMGLFFSRVIMAFASAALAGVCVCGGLLAACGGTTVGKLMVAGSWTPTAIAAAVAVFGMSFQLVTHKDDDTRAQSKAKSVEDSTRAREDDARDKRFAEYSRRGKPKKTD